MTRTVYKRVVIGGAAIAVSVGLTMTRGQPQPQVALTYDIIEQGLDANDELVERRKTFARRADGSFVEILWDRGADGALVEHRNITDLATGLKLIVDSGVKARVTYSLAAENVMAWRRQNSECDDRSAPRSSLLGHEVVLHTLAPADTGAQARIPVRIERWLAPDLGCVALEEQTFVTRNGTERLVTQRQATNLRVGEPDPALFNVPVDYQEMSPRELFGVRDSSRVLDEALMQRLESGYRDSQN